MPTPTRIVVYFDDGTSEEIDVRGMSSAFFRENAAVKCGHKPPYKQGKPPKDGGGTTGGEVTLMSDGESCYYVNGIIVCP